MLKTKFLNGSNAFLTLSVPLTVSSAKKKPKYPSYKDTCEKWINTLKVKSKGIRKAKKQEG